MLRRLGEAAIKEAARDHARHRICRPHPSRPRLRRCRGIQGLPHHRLRSPTALGCARSRRAGCRSWSPNWTICCGGASARALLHGQGRRSCAPATSFISRPTFRPTMRGQSDLSGISRLIEEVIPALGPNALLCVLCQVPPGFTRGLPVDPQRAVLSGRDAGFRPRGRAGHQTRAVHRRLRRSGASRCRRAMRRCWALRVSDPAHALRKRRACKIAINCCLVASLSVANTLAELCGADRRRLARDRPSAAARPAHWRLQLSRARTRHCRRQPRARPGDGAETCRRRPAAKHR